MSKFVRPAAEGADPFGTARLRRGVLDAWATGPARFREDANAEEDLVLGGYRDRLVVELAQNAADAAARAGVPGRLRLTLRDGVLVAANTGAPLDAAGVESLTTLRASAKREPRRARPPSAGSASASPPCSPSPTSPPSSAGTAGSAGPSPRPASWPPTTARHSPGLGDELRRRDGHVPLLRLPFAAEGTAPDPYDTAVVLPLRDAAAERSRRAAAATAVDDALLLALPGLDEVVIEIGRAEPRTLRRRTDGAVTVVDDSARRHHPLAHRRRPRPPRPRPARRPARRGAAAPALVGDLGRARGRRRRARAAPHRARRARAHPQRRAPRRPALLIASLPAGHHPPARRARPAHRLPGGARRRRVRRTARRLAAGDRRASSTWCPARSARASWTARLRAGDPASGCPAPRSCPPAARRPQDDDERDCPRRLRPADAEVVEGAGADTVRVLAEVLPTLLPAGPRTPRRAAHAGRRPASR